MALFQIGLKDVNSYVIKHPKYFKEVSLWLIHIPF